MERAAAIAQLPETYATALRLRDEDLDTEAIANRLGITVEAVEPLLRVAAAKLEHLLEATRPASQGSEEASA